MDKTIVYLGAIPQPADILAPQRYTEIALGMVMRAAFGTGPVIDGLTASQQPTPDMTVQVGPGAIIVQTVIDPTAVGFGTLPADTSTNIVKIGINTQPTTLTALVAPTIAGQSQNWLIQAQFLEQDTTPLALPYYNAANPSVNFSGPNNSAAAQNTRRVNTVQLAYKGGSIAAAGQQGTPAPDLGWVGVAIVTLTNGQASILNANITPYAGAPLILTKLPFLRIKMTANLNLYVSPTGNDASSGLSAAVPFATRQKAWNTIVNGYDLNGFRVTVNITNGAYSDSFFASGSLTGNTQGPNGVTFLGNIASPTSCIINVAAGVCFGASYGAQYSVSGMSMAAGGVGAAGNGDALQAQSTGSITLSGPCVFNACSNGHFNANVNGVIVFTSGYTIAGGALYHWSAASVASIIGGGVVITLTGNPGFGVAFANAYSAAVITCASITFSGFATGARFNVSGNAVIATNGSSVGAYLPGSGPGTWTSGGQYT